MSDQAGPAADTSRYVYTLADKNWLLDYSDRNSTVNVVDLGTALAEYVNSKRSVHAIKSMHDNAAYRWFHHGGERPRTRIGTT
jgi:hypothetical protein